MRIQLLIILLTLWGCICQVRSGTNDPIVLLISDQVAGERVVSVSEFVDYMKKAQQIWDEVIPEVQQRSKTVLVVAFGVGYRPEAWIFEGEATRKHQEQLNKKIRMIKTPAMNEGVMTFAVLGEHSKAAAASRNKSTTYSAPIPPEWKEVVEKAGSPMTTDKILEKVLTRDTAK